MATTQTGGDGDRREFETQTEVGLALFTALFCSQNSQYVHVTVPDL
jgi:hypothetical protein